MSIKIPPFGSALDAYERQAEVLLAAWEAKDAEAVGVFQCNFPRFLSEEIPWLPKKLSEAELRSIPLDLADARLALARSYGFANWPRLAEWVEAVAKSDSDVARFETAVEAVVNGDAAALQRMLSEHPELVRARSTIVTHHDPPVHGATLLHYIAANGVEGWRQRSPKNAVEIAKLLLDAGAEPDATADAYGEPCTTMSLLVSSCHPAEAGVQADLVNVLVDYGAAVESVRDGKWSSPLMTALAFGYRDAAEALVRRGVRIATLAAAAGLGRRDEAERLLPTATREDRHRATALAAQQGHVETLRLLLDAGEDPNRLNPEGNHSHSTPLHQAVWGGHEAVVRLLVERGARLDIADTIHHGTPLGWAEHGGRTEIAAYLRDAQAKRAATEHPLPRCSGGG